MKSILQNIKYPFIVLCLLTSFAASGKSIIQRTSLYTKNETLFVDVQSKIALTPAVVEALHNGLTLKFTYDFKIKNKSWYRLKSVATLSKVYYLSYHRTIGKYIVSDPVTFEEIECHTLNQAKQSIQTLYDFPLILLSQLSSNGQILLTRFHLSNDNLPLSMNIERYLNNTWDVDSDWYEVALDGL